MATNTSDFFTFSKTAGTAKNLQKPTDGGDNNLWGGYINVDLDTIVGAVNATSDLIADANQNELVDFTATGSAVNHVGITNAATGNGPTIEAKGDDSNVDLNVKPKGTGAILLKDGDGNELVKTSRTASAVNEVTVANAATGNGPTLSATGDDTNIDLNIAGKGSGTAKFTSNIIIPDAGNIGSVSDPDAIAIASDGGLTFNGGIDDAGTISAGTIGSAVSFPTGKLINSKFFRVNTGSGHTTNSSTDEAALNYVTFNCTSGNTIYFGYNFYAAVSKTSGSGSDERYARFKLFQSTGATRPAEGDTTDLGTQLWNAVYGRIMPTALTSTRTSYVPYIGSASFLATASTHHLGLVFNSEISGLTNTIQRGSTNTITFFAYEFEGDVVTTGAIP